MIITRIQQQTSKYRIQQQTSISHYYNSLKRLHKLDSNNRILHTHYSDIILK